MLLLSPVSCLRTSNGSSVGEFDNMQNTPIFQLVLCIIQACLGLDSLDFAYVMLVVWLCFRYTTLEASMRRNDEIRQRNTKSWKFSFRVTAVTLSDWQTVTLQLIRTVTSLSGRQHPWLADRHTLWRPSPPVTGRPSHPVTPVTGPGESVSPTFQKQFCSFLPTFSTFKYTIRPRFGRIWPINRSKEEWKRVGKSFRKH